MTQPGRMELAPTNDQLDLEPKLPIALGGLAAESGQTADVTDLASYRQTHVDAEASIINHETQTLTSEQILLFERFAELPIVAARKLVPNWSRHPEEYEEAVAVGNLGLVKAIKRYDKSKQNGKATSGITFVYMTVAGEIKRAWRDQNFKRHVNEQNETILEPKLSVLTGTTDSLDRPFGDDGSGSLLGVIPDKSFAIDDPSRPGTILKSAAEIVNGYIPRDREIFVRLTGLGQSQAEIAEALGISQVHVSRIIMKMGKDILKKLDLTDSYEPRGTKKESTKALVGDIENT